MKIPFRVNPKMEVNMSTIGGIMLILTVYLLETIDGFSQRS